jgi:hypothetical protein
MEFPYNPGEKKANSLQRIATGILNLEGVAA